MVTTCKTCGAKFPASEKQCPYCGNFVDQTEIEQIVNSPSYSSENEDDLNHVDELVENNQDSSSGRLNVLSVFFPIVGWILAIALKRRHPRKAKFCNLWAWIGFGIWCMFSLWTWICFK